MWCDYVMKWKKVRKNNVVSCVFFCQHKGVVVVVEFPVNQKKTKTISVFLSAEKMKKKQYQINRIVLELLNGWSSFFFYWCVCFGVCVCVCVFFCRGDKNNSLTHLIKELGFIIYIFWWRRFNFTIIKDIMYVCLLSMTIIFFCLSKNIICHIDHIIGSICRYCWMIGWQQNEADKIEQTYHDVYV